MRLESGLEVGARGEAATGPGDEHRADRLVGGLALHDRAKIAAELRRPRVERVRAVEDDSADAAGLFPQDCVVTQGDLQDG